MNKAELADAISAKVGVSKKEAEDMVEAFMSITTDTLKMNGEVVLAGFGTFSARVRAGRIGVNPQNPSEKITINPTKVAKFKAGKNLKDALKKSQHEGSAPAAPSTPATETPTPSAPASPPEPSSPADDSTGDSAPTS